MRTIGTALLAIAAVAMVAIPAGAQLANHPSVDRPHKIRLGIAGGGAFNLKSAERDGARRRDDGSANRNSLVRYARRGPARAGPFAHSARSRPAAGRGDASAASPPPDSRRAPLFAILRG
jgi:hypothetical protein